MPNQITTPQILDQIIEENHQANTIGKRGYKELKTAKEIFNEHLQDVLNAQEYDFDKGSVAIVFLRYLKAILGLEAVKSEKVTPRDEQQRERIQKALSSLKKALASSGNSKKDPLSGSLKTGAEVSSDGRIQNLKTSQLEKVIKKFNKLEEKDLKRIVDSSKEDLDKHKQAQEQQRKLNEETQNIKKLENLLEESHHAAPPAFVAFLGRKFPNNKEVKNDAGIKWYLSTQYIGSIGTKNFLWIQNDGLGDGRSTTYNYCNGYSSGQPQPVTSGEQDSSIQKFIINHCKKHGLLKEFLESEELQNVSGNVSRSNSQEDLVDLPPAQLKPQASQSRRQPSPKKKYDQKNFKELTDFFQQINNKNINRGYLQGKAGFGTLRVEGNFIEVVVLEKEPILRIGSKGDFFEISAYDAKGNKVAITKVFSSEVDRYRNTDGKTSRSIFINAEDFKGAPSKNALFLIKYVEEFCKIVNRSQGLGLSWRPQQQVALEDRFQSLEGLDPLILNQALGLEPEPESDSEFNQGLDLKPESDSDYEPQLETITEETLPTTKQEVVELTKIIFEYLIEKGEVKSTTEEGDLECHLSNGCYLSLLANSNVKFHFDQGGEATEPEIYRQNDVGAFCGFLDSFHQLYQDFSRKTSIEKKLLKAKADIRSVIASESGVYDNGCSKQILGQSKSLVIQGLNKFILTLGSAGVLFSSSLNSDDKKQQFIDGIQEIITIDQEAKEQQEREALLRLRQEDSLRQGYEQNSMERYFTSMEKESPEGPAQNQQPANIALSPEPQQQGGRETSI